MLGRRIDRSGQRVVLEWEPFPSPGDLPDPGIEPGSPALQADSLLSEPHMVYCEKQNNVFKN